jgi:hypothetical protein
MKVITTTLLPEAIPRITIDRWEHAGLGPDALAITAGWLPREDPGMGPPMGPWEFYRESLDHAVREILGSEFFTQQIGKDGINPRHLVPTREQLFYAVQQHLLESSGWVASSDTIAKFAEKQEEFAVQFARNYVGSKHIVTQRSPPDLCSLLDLLEKSKEWGAPFAGIWVGMQAASSTGINEPGIYLLCVAGGIVLVGPALSFGRAIATLTEAFTKRMVRRIAPP